VRVPEVPLRAANVSLTITRHRAERNAVIRQIDHDAAAIPKNILLGAVPSAQASRAVIQRRDAAGYVVDKKCRVRDGSYITLDWNMS